MIILDACKLTTREDAHPFLQEALSFPDYYGRNLDALYDCLTDLDETEVAFLNADEAEGTYFDKILAVFQDASEDNARLTIACPEQSPENMDFLPMTETEEEDALPCCEPPADMDF